MDYRDQLKYIKSHRRTDENSNRKNRKKGEAIKLDMARPARGEKKRRTSTSTAAGRGKQSRSLEKRSRESGKYRPGREDRTKRQRWHEEEERGSGRLRSVDRMLGSVQLISSVFFIAAMVILGILPLKYMIVLIAIVVLLIFVVKQKQKKLLRSRKKQGSGRGIAAIASVLFLCLGFYALKANLAIDKIAVGEESGKYYEEHGLSVTEKPFNVYISGIDVYGEITQESRSDVNLIATVNPNTHKILLTTTPRDYYIPIPGVSEGQNDKLTHAGIYGVDASMAALENLYETDIPFYVRVSFTSVEDIVDVMGGIDVESELAFTTGEDAGAIVDVQEGKNHFTGKEALAFVRERQALADGDNQRGKNQQALLTGLIKKTMSPMILIRANGMINSVAGNSETNMSEKQIKSLIRMQLDELHGWEIESVAALGDDSGKEYCYSYSGGPLYVTIPDWGSVEEIKQKMQAVLEE